MASERTQRQTLPHNHNWIKSEFTNRVKSREREVVLGREREACAILHLWSLFINWQYVTSPASLRLCLQTSCFGQTSLWAPCRESLMTTMWCSSRATASPSDALWSHNTPGVTSASSSLASNAPTPTATPNQLSITPPTLRMPEQMSHFKGTTAVFITTLCSIITSLLRATASHSLSLVGLCNCVQFLHTDQTDTVHVIRTL